MPLALAPVSVHTLPCNGVGRMLADSVIVYEVLRGCSAASTLDCISVKSSADHLWNQAVALWRFPVMHWQDTFCTSTNRDSLRCAGCRYD